MSYLRRETVGSPQLRDCVGGTRKSGSLLYFQLNTSLWTTQSRIPLNIIHRLLWIIALNHTTIMEGRLRWKMHREPGTDNLATTRTSLAIAGKDFCVVASDTRQSTGYNINSRYAPKAYTLADNAVIAMNGFHADGLTLKKVLDQRLKVG